MGGLTDRVRRLLGRRGTPDREEVWRAAAEELGGSFVPARGRRSDALRVDSGPWRIAVDTEAVSTGTSSTVFTRARAFYAGRRELRLKVVPRRPWHRWMEAVRGRRPFPVSPALLDRWTISGTPPARIPSVLSPGLVQALGGVPEARLDVGPASRRMRRRLGAGVGMVRCRTGGVVTKESVLVIMVTVVSHSLDALHRIGEASREPLPGDPATDTAGGGPPGGARRRSDLGKGEEETP